ncbi:MAG TPA: hypothetical protein P5533_06825 [Candidatus Cloacimonadota bacterium]|nr:hypothetical protein [Candidatus Cloacimonadota bacterium]
MKQNILLILALSLMTGFLFAGDFIIGSGTSTENYVPFYGGNDFGWSRFCFNQGELIASGMTNGAQITKIAFQLNNAISGYVTNNQTVYIGAFYDAAYNVTNYPSSYSGYTQVYNGSITWNGPGWMELTLSTPFTWDSRWGLEVLWENRDGTRQSPFPIFRHSSVSNSSIRKVANTSYPSLTNGTRGANRPNFWFITPATDLPYPGTALNPTDTSTGIDINSKLDWHHTGGDPTGYRLWLGTNNPPSNLVSNQVLDQSIYTPATYLDYGTTYYWRVVPFNDFGNALDCPVWSFTTLPDPTIYAFPYSQSFDDTFNPEGWTDRQGVLADPIVMGAEGSSQWRQDDWLNILSTDKAAVHELYSTMAGFCISPLFNISSDNFVVEFDLAFLKWDQPPTGTPPALGGVDDRFAVLVSDGFSWSTANIVREWNNTGSPYVLNEIPATGTHVSIPLTGFTGRKRIAIYAGSTVSNVDNDIMINNFTVKEMLQTPVLNISKDPVLNQMNISWPIVPNAVIYRIYSSDSPNGTFSELGTSDTNSYQTPATPSKAFFKVIAYSTR